MHRYEMILKAEATFTVTGSTFEEAFTKALARFRDQVQSGEIPVDVERQILLDDDEVMGTGQ